MRTIFITGSTDGIGKLAAIKLAKDGHQVVLHGRNSSKLEKVVDEVKALTNNKNISGYVADFSDLDAMREMSVQIKAAISKLDVLINNAGVFNSKQTLNNGLDIRMVVNYLAPYVLTNDLMPLLEKGDKTRIINLSSAAQSSVSLEALSGKQQRSEKEMYAQSKLALTMWSFDLAKQLSDITVIPVNPGSLLNTNMVREAFGQFWSSADKGGNILYDLAVSSKYEGVTNKYFDNDQGSFGMAHSDAYDTTKIEKLLKATSEILGNS